MRLIVLLAFSYWLAGAAVAVAQNWSRVDAGLDRSDGSFQDGGRTIRYVMLRARPGLTVARISDTYHELSGDNPYSAFSLTELGKKHHAVIMINAGSSRSLSKPEPAGLLYIDGVTRSSLNVRSKYSGILCLHRDSASIKPVTVNSSEIKSCTYAVQRGPLLTPGFVYPHSYQIDRHLRSAVAVDGAGTLIVIITRDPCTLQSLGDFFFRSGLDLKIEAVLNLDGDGSSGLILAPSDVRNATNLGNVDGLIASALEISPRSKQERNAH